MNTTPLTVQNPGMIPPVRVHAAPAAEGPILWGSFGFWHILSLIVAAGLIFGLFFLLRKRSEKIRTAVLFVLSLWGIAAIIYNLTMWNTPLEYLPLHLCSINAMILPAAVLAHKTRFGQFLGNLLPIYSIGAACAVIFNSGQADFELFSPVFLMYYLPHVLEFAIPWLLISFGMIKIRPVYIAPCVGATALLYTGVHFTNIALNNYFAANAVLNYLGEPVRVNYMYSLGHANNPALAFFWNLCPYNYYYMYMIFPVIIIIYLLMNIPEFSRLRAARLLKAKKSAPARP